MLALVGVGLIPVLLAGAGFIALLGEDAGSLPATVPVGGNDGLWLGHAWIDGRRTAADLDTLAGRLGQAGIRDVFVHVGPLSGDGSLNPALRPRARWLLTGLHHRLPGVRVQAWLGDLVGPGHLDLAGPATRSRVLGSAAQVLAEGFDGIHYDLEPVPSTRAHRGEAVAAAIRGVRLALGPHPPRRPIGVALYADYTATQADWTAYLTGWAHRHAP